LPDRQPSQRVGPEEQWPDVPVEDGITQMVGLDQATPAHPVGVGDRE
jgi:hypothetical protein